jgi:hypothetical protein
VAYHLVAGAWIAAIQFYYATFAVFNVEQVVVLKILVVTLALCFIVSIIGSRGRHPAWVAFFIAAVMTLLTMI